MIADIIRPLHLARIVSVRCSSNCNALLLEAIMKGHGLRFTEVDRDTLSVAIAATDPEEAEKRVKAYIRGLERFLNGKE